MKERLSDRITIYPLAIVLGISINLGTIFTLNLLHPDILTAQQVKKKKKVPPPPTPPAKGFPGNRTVSASMSGDRCDLPLVALVPEFTPKTAERIAEKSVWGQTAKERPTFWFFVPSTPSSTQFEFSLQDRQGEDIYRSPIPTPSQPGVISVRIPPTRQPLQLDRDYRWTLKAKVPCGTSALNRVHIDGWVTRVSLPSAGNRSDTYTEKAIWYDAVTNLAQQRLQKPQDVRLQKDWSDLLESVNLEEISKQPLLK